MSLAAPQRPSSRPERVAFALVFCLGFGLELAVMERKYAIFGGGFGQSEALHQPFDILLFFIAAGSAHLLALASLSAAIAAAMPRPDQRLHRMFTLAYAGLGLGLAVLMARLQLMTYFSDTMSLNLIRDLGGGSLAMAFLFAVEQGTMPIVLLALALLGYAVGFWTLKRRARRPDFAGPRLKLGGRRFALFTALTIGVCFWANVTPHVRGNAGHMSAYLALRGVLGQTTDFDGDGYGLFFFP